MEKEKAGEHRPSLVWTKRCRAAELGPDTLRTAATGWSSIGDGGSVSICSRFGPDLTGDAPYLEVCTP